MRSWLLHWLLTSRKPCRIGLHMPVESFDLTVDDVLSARRDVRCAACEKVLRA